jgi:hypothetical protein
MKYAICIPKGWFINPPSQIVRELACCGIYYGKFNLQTTKLFDSYHEAVRCIKLNSETQYPANHNAALKQLTNWDGYDHNKVVHRIDFVDTPTEFSVKDLGTMEEYHES